MNQTTLAEFLANVSEGATALLGVVQDVGDLFMQPPFVLIPIAGVTYLGYKIGMAIMRKVKNAA